MTSRTVFPGAAAAVALLLVLTGCTPEAPEPTVAPVDRAPLDLSVGTLLPATGTLAAFGPSAVAAAELAAGDINNADAGITVTITSADSGDATTDTSIASTTTLLDGGASVIVGALSDNVSRKVLDQIVSAGAVEISPGNTSTDFTRAADHDLYWRTAPSCVLEGDAMGKQIAADGVTTLGVVYESGFCEPGLPEALSAAFERAGGTITASVPYTAGAADLSAQVTTAIADKPEAVVVVGSKGAQASVPSLAAAKYDGSHLYFVGLGIGNHSADIPAGTITGSIASMPGLDISKLGDFTDRLLDINPALTDFSYAAESYDAVVLAALAALAANSTKGADIASSLREVSGGEGKGTKATDFASAAKVILAGGVVDYDGISGEITFDAKGDPQGAVIGMYRYGKDNAFERIN
ncbi:MAG: amino acid transporter substrate-binding protein [Rhodoglobus sp.]|nr:amino acid transporter substrate-binding protein [Rhodoglobus sp.]